MTWLHVLAIWVGNIGIVIPLFLWIRSESNADRREIHGILREMKDEMKDFHYRLLEIEKNRK
jgi:hypothetical protein